MKRKLTIFLAPMIILLLGLAVLVSPAQAGDRISRGDAMAVLNAFPTARRIVSNLENGIGAAHFAEFRDVAIFPTSFRPGVHYCEEVHQVGLQGFFSSGENGYREAAASLNTIGMDFSVDGEVYETMRTPVKRWLPASEPVRYGFAEGFIIAPGDLAVGRHTIELQITLAGTPLPVWSNFFYIDAAGTGVCQ